MKIIYLKLENFAGIYNGLGRKELELDLTKGSNHITLLVGKNGSGKSTVMSTLHPFAGTFDDKSSFILDKHDGYKEIHIIDNDVKYIIKHIYSNKKKTKSTKSFISYIDENGDEVELNENGGVKTFEEIVKNKLDLVPSFLTLSRIGSSVSNFIDKKSTDRKKIITEFLPDIADFMYSYKVVNDKWSNCKKEIKSVVDRMNKIDNIDHLTERLLAKETERNNLEDKIVSETKIVTESEYELLRIDPDGKIKEKYIESGTQFNSLGVELQELNKKSYGKYDSLEVVKESKIKLENKRIKVKSNIENSTKIINSSKERILSNTDQLETKQALLDKNKLDKDLSEYYALQDDYNEEIEDLQNEISELEKYSYYKNHTLEMLNEYDSQFSKLEENILSIKSNYDSYLYEIKDFTNSKAALKSIKDVIENKKIILTYLMNDNRNMINGLKQIEVLENRPKTCSDDTCPFIKEALKYAKLDLDLAKNQQEIDKVTSEIKSLEAKLEKENEIATAKLELQSQYNFIKNSTILSSMQFFKDLSISSFMSFILENKSKYKDISEIKDYVSLNEDLLFKQEKLKEVESNIKILESRNDLIVSLESDITKIENDNIELQDIIDNAEKEISDNEITLNKLDKLESLLEEAESTYTRINEIETERLKLGDIIKSLSEDAEKIKNCNRILKDSKGNISEYQNLLNPINKEIEKIKFDIQKVNEYNTSKIELESKFNNLEIVRNALNPNKGIPLLFINTYLTKTKLIANKLLDVAFKGKFQIVDFEVTDKDFFIKLQKEDGEMLSDVIYASQGERSLISLAISMALIQQSMRRYNILLLDEVDAELDASNRKAFIDILETQFEMLGIEQCFLITHNNEFDTYNTNLILFKNHGVDINNKEYMSNKEIIFKV